MKFVKVKVLGYGGNPLHDAIINVEMIQTMRSGISFYTIDLVPGAGPDGLGSMNIDKESGLRVMEAMGVYL